jgi:Universal stress protein UspA and related nucleotide-binding proteins
MRKVLIPTDFSDNALNAVRYALELFKYERSEFFIIHAFADEVYESDAYLSRELFDDSKEKIKKRSDKELRRILDQIDKWSPNPKHQYHTLSLFGTLIDEANELVDRENIDVLVMGTKGKTDDRDITFGSNTLQVLKYVKCPVLAVPVGYPPYPPKTLLFPSDFLLPFKKRELKLVSTMAKRFVTEINFLHMLKFENVSFRQEDNKAFLECCMNNNIIQFHKEKGKELTSAINSFIEKNRIDMLVMVNSRHSFLEDYLYQSTIDKIGLHIKIPFLVLQNLPR